MTTRDADFGGFSSRTMAIDLRFGDVAQIDHFLAAWSRQGPPPITADTAQGRIEQISVGTTLEHELRHYHDFLLSYPSVHNLWMKLQVAMNAAPLIYQLLEDPETDVIPFPLIPWAEMEPAARAAYLEDALGAGHGRRVWSPEVIAGARPEIDLDRFQTGREPGFQRDILFLVREHLETVMTVRQGIVAGGFPHRINARFIFELSSFLIQAASVRQTYGVAEMDEFVNRLSADRSIYAGFFSIMIAMIHERGPLSPDRWPLVIDSQDVNWDILSAIATWCVLGCYEDGAGVYPETRLARLLEDALTDFGAVFPEGLRAAALVDHFDRRFGMTPYREALRVGQTRLEGFHQRASARILSSKTAGELHQRGVRVLEGVLKDRQRLIDRLIGSIDDYLHLARYASQLPHWPQCPVQLNFYPAGTAIHRELLGKLGEAPRFNVIVGEGQLPADYALDVTYGSFFPGGSSIPLDDVLALGAIRTLCDLFTDPAQTTPVEEAGLRALIRSRYGKELIRIM